MEKIFLKKILSGHSKIAFSPFLNPDLTEQLKKFCFQSTKNNCCFIKGASLKLQHSGRVSTRSK